MIFYNKAKWVLGILIVFVLIVATNLIDRNNFIQVKESVVTIYEDRLVANDLIFEMSKSIQEKELAVAVSDSVFFLAKNAELNKDVERFVLNFEQTKLTPNERKIFDEFKINLAAIIKAENVFLQSNMVAKVPLTSQISKVKKNLYDLSKIQLKEGGRQTSISKKAVNTVELFTQIEIYLLIFLAIIVQVIVMYKPKKK